MGHLWRQGMMGYMLGVDMFITSLYDSTCMSLCLVYAPQSVNNSCVLLAYNFQKKTFEF